jgi:salicylate hydroxylase
MPLGREVERRHGAPYLTLHRADLHAALLETCQTGARVRIEPNFEVMKSEERGVSIAARSGDGREFEGALLIAADGLWSKLRACVAPGAVPRATGQIAWRALLPRRNLPSPFDAPAVGLWLGPGAHLVHYPVRGGSDLNLVAVVDRGRAALDADSSDWNRSAQRSEVLAAFAQWPSAARALLERAETWRGWSLHSLPPLPRWSLGRMTLLGDAAHPVLPFLAQGAALATEDAVALAECLDACGLDNPVVALARYEALRRRRTAHVQRLSARMRRVYHLRALPRLARNFVLRHRKPSRLLGGFDWLYGTGAEAPSQ